MFYIIIMYISHEYSHVIVNLNYIIPTVALNINAVSVLSQFMFPTMLCLQMTNPCLYYNDSTRGIMIKHNGVTIVMSINRAAVLNMLKTIWNNNQMGFTGP